MDRMRQDASEETLKDSLKKGLEMLDKIKVMFVFHYGRTNDILRNHPCRIAIESGDCTVGARGCSTDSQWEQVRMYYEYNYFNYE